MIIKFIIAGFYGMHMFVSLLPIMYNNCFPMAEKIIRSIQNPRDPDAIYDAVEAAFKSPTTPAAMEAIHQIFPDPEHKRHRRKRNTAPQNRRK
jgi:hypothetical protein